MTSTRPPCYFQVLSASFFLLNYSLQYHGLYRILLDTSASSASPRGGNVALAGNCPIISKFGPSDSTMDGPL